MRSATEKTVSSSSQSPESFVPSNAPLASGSSQSGQILRIRVEVPRDLQGRVTLWNSQGQLVRRLFEGNMPHGTWALDWDQKNDQGLLVQSGSYSVHIEAGGQTLSGQVIVTPGS
jgi:flagellar hook assembly protein FlgD